MAKTSKTNRVTVSGEIKWANRLFVADTAFDPAGVFGVQFKPDSASEAILRTYGLRLQPKDGFINIKRHAKKTFRKPDGSSETVEFGPPTVTFNGGSAEDIRIGNGSMATLVIDIFPAGRFTGHRLQSVDVTTLIEYNPEPNNSTPQPVTSTNSNPAPF